jgi:hypothetical protein
MLALAQGGPRLSGNTLNVFIIVLVATAVVLVYWASRPSVIARYQSSQQPPAHARAEHTAPADGEPRA